MRWKQKKMQKAKKNETKMSHYGDYKRENLKPHNSVVNNQYATFGESKL